MIEKTMGLCSEPLKAANWIRLFEPFSVGLPNTFKNGYLQPKNDGPGKIASLSGDYMPIQRRIGS